MNRMLILGLGLLGAAMPLVMDSALKGAALLGLAALAALLLWRASAAARHMVWLVAVVALLLVPLLSALLPGWRVLPQWAVAPNVKVTVSAGALENRPYKPDGAHGAYAFEHPTSPEPDVLSTRPPELPPLPETAPAPLELAQAISTAPVSGSWRTVLPGLWLVGCGLLLLRLLGAHWMLRKSSRGCSEAPVGSLTEILASCARHMGVRQRVRLLLDQKRTIPVVWGVWRPRLILPAEALAWDDGQLQSVFLHELAHIRRRDTLVQWITQLACAFHWFNPLVWLAAWRLHVERERACDDMVLASGVKASSYASHLLHVASQLAPARWTSACGLAMARKSSLEGRLLAVLSGSHNRRGVTRWLTLAAVLLTAVIAVPLAMLRAADTDKPKSAQTTVAAEPKTTAATQLFNHWKLSARADGKIPGGCIGQVAASLKTYMDLNAGTDYATKCEAVFKKCDATHDWTPADAVALLDEIETVATDHAAWTMRAINERQIHPGKSLPDELKDAPWGTPAANGLRMAWLCGGGILPPSQEPAANPPSSNPPSPAKKPSRTSDPQHDGAGGQNAPATLGSILTSRVLFHNTGEAPVCFATEDWIQSGTHNAKDANGKDIPIHATSRMGIRTRMIFRLAPGEYAEVVGHGIGIGSHETAKETDIRKVGAWIEAKEGDVVTFTPGKLLVSFQTWQNNEGRKDSETVWNEIVSARLAQEGPNPATEKDRAALLARVSADLGITLPYISGKHTYATDPLPDSFERLTKRFLYEAKLMRFEGDLLSGATVFSATTTAATKPHLPELPDAAYAKPGFHYQKFREEDAKRPGGELMGAVLEPSKPGDLDKEPLVLGVRTASDAQWRIGGTAKVGLVVRNRSDSDVKFPYTGRLDNGLSVVAVDVFCFR